MKEQETQKKWLASGHRPFLEGGTRKERTIGYGMVQLCVDHEGQPKYGEYGTVPAKCECQKSIQKM